MTIEPCLDRRVTVPCVSIHYAGAVCATDPGFPMPLQPTHTLRSRTFIGLLFAQFTATFNDQAIHMVAIFYASDMLVRYLRLQYVDEKAVVSIVTACFITPFLLFSPFGGVLADKFSKRSIIVFWKVAEVLMMLTALVGLSLPHLAEWGWLPMPTAALWSAILVVSTVFLMGTHSTFFVPAKYGAMPEIMHPTLLSRGNGFLEGTSFTAQIFGTSVGGILYAMLKSDIHNGVLIPGKEWVIGVLLVLLAGAGTCTAFLIDHIPTAAPDRKLTWNWWQPLRENLRILWGSKPLTLAVLGISFAAFMTLFLRQTLLYEGELSKEIRTVRMMVEGDDAQADTEQNAVRGGVGARLIPVSLDSAAQQSELRVALLIALVGFGVGIGSLLAGFLSGTRVELGLVPIGGACLSLLTFLPALLLHHMWMVVVSLFLIGMAAGLYIVPLYTLLQHRAPKQSKGNVIAASNFLNVVGGIAAVLMFYCLTYGLERLFSPTQSLSQAMASHELVAYFEQLQGQMRVPRSLFAATAIFTVTVLVLLFLRLPDFFVRTLVWLRSGGRSPIRVEGLDNLPADGPAILVTNCRNLEESLQVLSATDRFTRVIQAEGEEATCRASCLRRVARAAGMVSIRNRQEPASDWQAAFQKGLQTLQQGDLVSVSIDDSMPADQVSRLLNDWQQAMPVTIVPVHFSHEPCRGRGRRPRVKIGIPQSGTLSVEQATVAVAAVGESAIEG